MVLKRSMLYLLMTFPLIGFECGQAQVGQGSSTSQVNSNLGHSFNTDLLGQSASHMFQVTIPDEDLKSKLKALNIPALRFPGGTGSNFYHFYEKGYGFKEEDIRLSKGYPPYDKLMVRLEKEKGLIDKGFTAENYAFRFADLAIDLNSPIVLVLNIFSGSDNENLDLIRFFEGKGIEIKGLELGNENYFRSFASEFPDAHEYMNRCKKLTMKIKREFPHLKVAVTAANAPSDTYKGLEERFRAWNRVVSSFDFYDAAVVHFYSKTPQCDQLEDIEERFQCATKQSLENANDWLNKGLDYYGKTFSDVPLWLTEYNVKEVYKYYGNTLYQTLYNAHLLLNLLDDERVDLATYHVLYTYSYGFAMLSKRKDGAKERVAYNLFKMMAEMDDTFNKVEEQEWINTNQKIDVSIWYSQEKNNYQAFVLNFDKISKEYSPLTTSGKVHFKGFYGENLVAGQGQNPYRDNEYLNEIKTFDEIIEGNKITIRPYSFSKITWSGP